LKKVAIGNGNIDEIKLIILLQSLLNTKLLMKILIAKRNMYRKYKCRKKLDGF